MMKSAVVIYLALSALAGLGGFFINEHVQEVHRAMGGGVQ